jgi:hypothetical protein
MRIGEQAIALDSDLSVHAEITSEELEAIGRLLGDDLKNFLSEA